MTSSATHKAKVLLVEDDPALVHMYRNQLEYDGYQVHTASDGAVGLSLIESERPDVVLLDLMMPTMNGLEVLDHLHQQDSEELGRVIVLTNMMLPETLNAVESYGIKALMIKSEHTPMQVSQRVTSLLHRAA